MYSPYMLYWVCTIHFVIFLRLNSRFRNSFPQPAFSFNHSITGFRQISVRTHYRTYLLRRRKCDCLNFYLSSVLCREQRSIIDNPLLTKVYQQRTLLFHHNCPSALVCVLVQLPSDNDDCIRLISGLLGEKSSNNLRL